ncbi:MAG: polysaccharide deacetylase family protein [Clostridiales bacterium]|nr:polysaccharide deacetylase family protein [Clostridiales bacterium]
MKYKNIGFNLILWSSAILVAILGVWALKKNLADKPTNITIDPAKPMVALTFDDGPNPQFTPQVLEILADNEAYATFFINGKNLTGNETLLQAITDSGHELGNHSYFHLDLTTLDAQEMDREFRETQHAVNRILPNYPLLYFRPPYGRYNDIVTETACIPMVLWDIDSGDWEKTTSENIVDQVLSAVKDGDVIIFHDDNAATVEALTVIVPVLKEWGFQCATISQLNQARSAIE